MVIKRRGTAYTCRRLHDWTLVQLCVFATWVTKCQFCDFVARNKNTDLHLIRITGIV